MVCATLADQKSKTRRVVKLAEFCRSDTPGYDWSFRDRRGGWNDIRNATLAEHCPHGQPGCRLWVKESWCELTDENPPHATRFYYCATQEEPLRLSDGDGFTVYNKDGSEKSPWKSARFMPRAASRLTLDITDIRVERVQDITSDDILAEGVRIPTTAEGRPLISLGTGLGRYLPAGFANAYDEDTHLRALWWHLWESIHGIGAKDVPTWVWVISFRRITADTEKAKGA